MDQSAFFSVVRGRAAASRMELRRLSMWAVKGQVADRLALPLMAVSLLLRLYRLDNPGQSVIWDENWYVPAARTILGWPVPEGQHYIGAEPGIDPNTEHLPLAKLIMAGSMRLLGDNPWGWRLPSVAFGMLALVMLYLLVRRASGRPWLALFATFIFSFDNLVFVHSRVAALDIYMIGLMLLGLYLYVAERPALAGGALALSTLAKYNGALGLIVIAVFEVMRLALRAESRDQWRRSISKLSLILGVFVVVFMAVGWPIDLMFTHYRNPVDSLSFAQEFGLNYRTDSQPKGDSSFPWEWLVNGGTRQYYGSSVMVMAGDKAINSWPVVRFMGQMNPYIIWMLPLALANLIWATVRSRDHLPLLLLSLFLVTYLQPLAFALLFSRQSFIHYFLPVLPAVCVAIAYFLMDARLPRFVAFTYGVAVLCGFALLFPFRTLPW
jgi:dolichyl-phosphate-mannose-protein mannosyltransferase